MKHNEWDEVDVYVRAAANAAGHEAVTMAVLAGVVAIKKLVELANRQVELQERVARDINERQAKLAELMQPSAARNNLDEYGKGLEPLLNYQQQTKSGRCPVRNPVGHAACYWHTGHKGRHTWEADTVPDPAHPGVPDVPVPTTHRFERSPTDIWKCAVEIGGQPCGLDRYNKLHEEG